MNRKAYSSVFLIAAVLVLAAATGTQAQAPRHMKFRGIINDYTPANVGGPWEVRGHWSLTVDERSSKADFSAALTMEQSDQGIIANGGADFNTPSLRSAHTHHITMEGAAVTDMPGGGIQVSGPITLITKDGSSALPGSSLQIEITGGTNIEYSNITITFSGGAAKHFGTQPVHGAIRNIQNFDNSDR